MSGREGRAHLMIARTGIFLAGSLATMVAGLIIARRLSPDEYAAFQSLTKRTIQYVVMTLVLYEAWLIRDTVARSSSLARATLLYTVLSSSVGALTGALLVYAITGSTLYSLLAAAGGALMGLRAVLGTMLDVVRPVRAPLVILAGRLTYLGGVVLLVQLLRQGLLGALASFIARTVVIIASLAYYALPIIRQASRAVAGTRSVLAARARASVFRFLSYLLPNIDVPLAVAIARDNLLISGFFVARLIPFTLVDIVRNTFRYLQAAFSHGWSPREVLVSIRVSVAMVTPILAFSAVYSEHVVCLINCEYLWARPMLVLFSVEAVFLLATVALENAYLGAVLAKSGSAEEHARRVEDLYRTLLPSYALYIAVLLAGLLAYPTLGTRGTGLVWAAAVLAMTASYSFVIAVMTAREMGGRPVARLYTGLAGYLALGLLVAGALPWVGGEPSHLFWVELRALAPPAVAYYAAMVAVLLLVDPAARRMARAVLLRART